MAKSNKVLAGLIAGVLVGAAAGVLLTPKPGRQVRQFVRGRTAGVTNRASQGFSKGVDTVRNRLKKSPASPEPADNVVYSRLENEVEG